MAINIEATYTTTGVKDAIPVNRHGNPQYSVGIDIGGGGDVTVQATLSQINRSGVVPIWFDIPALVNITANTFDKIVDTPLEAIRLNITTVTDTIILQVAQNT